MLFGAIACVLYLRVLGLNLMWTIVDRELGEFGNGFIQETMYCWGADYTDTRVRKLQQFSQLS